MSQVTNDQLDDLVRQIKNDFPNEGYRRVDSHAATLSRDQGFSVSS